VLTTSLSARHPPSDSANATTGARGARLPDVDLRDWIVGEHAAVLPRFEHSVVAAVPLERWTDPVGAGGSSIAWLAFHAALHEDLAVNAVLRRTDLVLGERRSALGLDAVPLSAGLGEAEQPEVTAALALDHLLEYVRSVSETTAAWLETLTDDDLDRADADGPSALERAGIDEGDVPWLHRMWDTKPAAWFVQWEAIGHRLTHLGEMVSVRNRLGLSPF
jgi:hypothetical protein